MSIRFYVNGVQIFGNNEMFNRTFKELERQGADMDDDFIPEFEIKDPQALMEAIEYDSLVDLRERCTREVFNSKTHKYTDLDFQTLKDSDLILENDGLKEAAYEEDGTPKKNVYRFFAWWIKSKRLLTSYNLYMAIKDDVETKDGKLVLKEGHKITAEMY